MVKTVGSRYEFVCMCGPGICNTGTVDNILWAAGRYQQEGALLHKTGEEKKESESRSAAGI